MPPAIEIAERLNVALPVLVKVTPWLELVVPTACAANVTLLGDKLATGAGGGGAPQRAGAFAGGMPLPPPNS